MKSSRNILAAIAFASLDEALSVLSKVVGAAFKEKL